MTNPIVVARRVQFGENDVRLHHYYWCPGCNALHGVAIRPDVNSNGAGWEFSGTLERPTYSPSQLTTYGVDSHNVCHTFIREGMIQYLNDCTHSMRGQTVPLPPLPDWFIRDVK